MYDIISYSLRKLFNSAALSSKSWSVKDPQPLRFNLITQTLL